MDPRHHLVGLRYALRSLHQLALGIHPMKILVAFIHCFSAVLLLTAAFKLITIAIEVLNQK